MPRYRNRADSEYELAQALGEAGQEAAEELEDALGDEPQPSDLNDSFWSKVEKLYQAAVTAALLSAAEGYLTQRQGEVSLPAGIPDIDWTAVHDRMAEAARKYSYDLVGGITDASRQMMRDSLSAYVDGKLTEEQLVAKIGEVFGPSRAATIAQTETTRITTMGETEFENALNAMGLKTEMVWETWGNACAEICQPLQGTKRGDGWRNGPPNDSHPNCDCSVTVEIVEE